MGMRQLSPLYELLRLKQAEFVLIIRTVGRYLGKSSVDSALNVSQQLLPFAHCSSRDLTVHFLDTADA